MMKTPTVGQPVLLVRDFHGTSPWVLTSFKNLDSALAYCRGRDCACDDREATWTTIRFSRGRISWIINPDGFLFEAAEILAGQDLPR